MIIWEAKLHFHGMEKKSLQKREIWAFEFAKEFDTLKSQVNPHFLSITSIPCLRLFRKISNRPKKVPRWAEQSLSLLPSANNEDGMTTLKVNSSSFCPILNYSKHGVDAIQLWAEIDKKYENYLLPSLSLQMFVENAVKHNALSKHNPLVIEIFKLPAINW